MIVCSATAKNKESTLLYNCLKGNSIPFCFKENNEDSLAVVYNQFIEKYKDEHDWIVFVHDDVTLLYPNALKTALNGVSWDLVGLAGSINIDIKKPTLWHLMCDRSDWRGAVSHYIDDTHFVTSFGPMPSRCIMIDGVFMAIRTNSLDDNIRFDETNKGKWHLYDIDFCLSCNKYKKKIGVFNYPVIHKSNGLESFDEAFNLSQEWFLDKWGSV